MPEFEAYFGLWQEALQITTHAWKLPILGYSHDNT